MQIDRPVAIGELLNCSHQLGELGLQVVHHAHVALHLGLHAGDLPESSSRLHRRVVEPGLDRLGLCDLLAYRLERG